MKYFILIISVLLSSCGDPSIDIDQKVYEPKIVVDAYLIVKQRVENIFIKRNFPVTGVESSGKYYLYDAKVTITDLNTNTSAILAYDNTNKSFSDQSNVLGLVKANNKYRIQVEATVAGRQLKTSSTTVTPAAGFSILEKQPNEKKRYPLTTDERNSNKFKVKFKLVGGAECYIGIIKPISASQETFINYPRNIYIGEEIDKANYLDEVGKVEEIDVLNLGNAVSDYTKEIEWRYFNFVSNYRIIFFAADQNYKDFYYTNEKAQAPDGNFSEPVFNFEGDGIGVFGSAITDTVFYEVTL